MVIDILYCACERTRNWYTFALYGIIYTRFGGSGSIRLEECHLSGYLFDLTMQLAIIMILKQAIGNVMELGVPFFKGYLRKKKESGFEGKPWKRDICLEQEPIYKPVFLTVEPIFDTFLPF